MTCGSVALLAGSLHSICEMRSFSDADTTGLFGNEMG